MKRLYFIAEDLDTTEKVAKCLLTHGVEGWHFHVLSKDSNGLLQHNIRSARFWHKTDLVRQSEQGALIGMITGIISAGFYAAFNPELLPLPMATWLLFILGPMVVFGWFGAIWGSRMMHYKISRFKDEIDYGGYLLMIDVPRERVAEMRQLLLSRISKLQPAGADNTLTLPFATQ